MSKPQILVTDTLFILDEHATQLRAAGFDIVRFPKPQYSEDELCDMVRGKTGYIMGGVEKLTDKVVAAADMLKACVFTGTDYRIYMPGHAAARKKGIRLARCAGANARAVAEYAVALVCMSARSVSLLTSPASPGFLTTKGFSDTRVGIIGYGAIGCEVEGMLHGLGFKTCVLAYRGLKAARHSPVVAFEDMAATCDIVTLHVNKARGQNILDRARIGMLRLGTAIVNTAFVDAVDAAALLARIRAGELTAAYDEAHAMDGAGLAPWQFLHNPKTCNAYNTFAANKAASDRATTALLDLLAGRNSPEEITEAA